MADGSKLDAVLAGLGEDGKDVHDISRAHFDLGFTDLGNAERLALRYRNSIRYVPGLGWHVWDGKHWALDDVGRILECAKEVTVNAIEVALKQGANADKLLKHGVKSQSAGAIRAMVSLAQSIPSIVVRSTELDQDENLLCVENGTIDLRTGILGPHRREHLITKMLPIVYDAVAKCPRWDSFLSRVLGGDPELVSYVQRAVGYTLTASVREQVLFILHGEGKNGKSTFTKTLQALLGSYAIQAAETLLLDSGRTEHTTEKVDLQAKRLAVCSETPKGKFFNENRVKELTGGDLITGRRMHSNNITFAPTHKFWICTNNKPNVREISEAIRRRLKFVPFTVTIPEAERDKDLESKLRAELPGILAWAVRGCLEWQAKGLGAAEKVEASTKSYFEGQDIVARFVRESCDVGAAHSALAGVLYGEFRTWSSDNVEGNPMSQTAFGIELTRLGYPGKHTRSGSLRQGLRIKR